MSLPTLSFQVTPTGITAPAFAEVLAALQQQFQVIFGPDAYLAADSQDGQLLGVFSQAISDVNAAAINLYNSFSPATAQGAALSLVVKINGIARLLPTHSQATVTLVGIAGTLITNGLVADTDGNQWALPATATIPVSGQIDVLAVAVSPGSIQAAPGAINTIATPTYGWQSVTNAQAAAVGAPVESDAALRKRQAFSVALPSLSVLDGIVGAVANLPGVLNLVAYENDTGVTDANGLPPHSIALVVEGGDPIAICTTIALKKTPGTYAWGTTVETIVDAVGVPNVIGFFVPTQVQITVAIGINALAGYLSTTGAQVQQAVLDYITALPIGGGVGHNVEWDAVIAAAKSVANSSTFRIVSVALSRPGAAGTPDVHLSFNEMAVSALSAITVSVV
jgi:uncharacterized phage protein gp47/JayE